jgi:hypothetical protein
MTVTVLYPAEKFVADHRAMRFDVPDQGSTHDILEEVWRRMNVVDNSDIELPQKFKCRSMCVGDVVILHRLTELEYHVCDSCGFRQVTKTVAENWTKLEGRDRRMGFEWVFKNIPKTFA